MSTITLERCPHSIRKGGLVMTERTPGLMSSSRRWLWVAVAAVVGLGLAGSLAHSQQPGSTMAPPDGTVRLNKVIDRFLQDKPVLGIFSGDRFLAIGSGDGGITPVTDASLKAGRALKK